MYSRSVFPNETVYLIYKAVHEMQESLQGPHDGYMDEKFAAETLKEDLANIIGPESVED